MPNPVTVQQVSLDTVAIAVQAIRVGRKQMTQAVFKQLSAKHPYDFVASCSRGVLWGVVNYFWDGCDSCAIGNKSHLHTVWQDGEQLFRGCVHQPEQEECYRLAESPLKQLLRMFRQLFVLDCILERPEMARKTLSDGTADTHTAFMWCGERVDFYEHDTILCGLDYITETDRDGRLLNFEKGIGQLRDARQRLIDSIQEGVGHPVAVFEEEYAYYVDLYKSKLDNYADFWAVVSKLPQLFIAV